LKKKTKVIFPMVKHVAVTPLITTIIWDDDTATEVTLDDDPFDEEKAVLWAIAKKALGSSTKVSNAIILGKFNKGK
jgi:hypothetical protein